MSSSGPKLSRALREQHVQLTQFHLARMRVQEEWKSNRLWINSIDNVLSRTVLYELVNLDYDDDHFSKIIRHAVIGVVYQTDPPAVYNWINSRLQIKEAINKQLSVQTNFETLDLAGSYSYYRYFRDDTGTVSEMRRGLITIRNDKNFVFFGHRPADARSLDGYDDTGMCFIVDRRMYMLGFRSGNIRLGIAQIPKNPRHDPFLGLVLSTSTRHDKLIFSSFFVMFHSLNIASQYELKKEDIEKIYSECLGNNLETGFAFVKNVNL